MSHTDAASADQDPTLAHLRKQFASGNMDDTRNALLRLSPQGRSEIEARLGKAAVARMYGATRRVRVAPLGRVVVIHGIMGGKLASVDATGNEDLVWVNYLRLVAGRISDFALDSNAESLDPGISIVTRGLLDEYMPLVFELSQRWRVLPFAFDWRLDIDNSAAALDREIRQWANGEPVHIVAHSMGGLVSRRFMQKFPETWEAMKDSELKRGGRLVMLGTPNKGSFAISFVLTGREKLLKKLALFDLKHDMKALLQTVNTFPGSYQMLPSPRLESGDDRLRLFDAATWGGFPVPQKYLDRGRRFQEEMDQVLDPDRLIYVAGYNQATPNRIRIDGPGNFSYQETLDGDGRVPHELGLLPGVASFYVDEVHGDLPSNERVLAGIHDLLATGSTTQMPSTKPVARTAQQLPRWRTADEIAPMPSPVPSRRGAVRTLTRESAAAIESDLLDSFLGRARSTATSLPELGDLASRSRATNIRNASAPAGHEITIEVVWGDISKVQGDVLAVGHYQGVEPQAGELALDRAISGVTPGSSPDRPEVLVITSHTRRGILRGSVGDINFFPWLKAGKVAAVAGMGHPGTFGILALQRTARALAESVASLPDAQTVCTLLIGSGNGNLSVPLALKTMLDGFEDALRSGLQVSSLRRVRIVERELHKAQAIAEALATLPRVEGLSVLGGVQRGSGGVIGEQIAVSAILLAAASRLKGNTAAARTAATALLRGFDATPQLQLSCEEFLKDLPWQEAGDFLRQAGSLGFGRLPKWRGTDGRAPTRISFVRDSVAGGMRVAAISDTAVVAERLVSLDWSVVEELVRKSADPGDLDDLQAISQLMTLLFVPRDFREKIDIGDSLIVELDRDTAPIHWEMLESFYDATSDEPLALTRPMARQLRTSYSPIPPRPYEPQAKLRALVVGDPGDPDKGLSLEGARIEALEIAAMLRDLGVEVDLLIGADNVPREGPLLAVAPATRFEMLRLLNGHDYDILHYAGHGDFDPAHPERAGWLFGHSAFTGRELAMLSRAPTLVVANACLSALTSNVRADGGRMGETRLDQALLPTLVDEFFMCGVRNYIGTAWEVSDAGAVLFSRKFYETLLKDFAGAQPATLGNALLAARKLLRSEERAYGMLWAAYQHYGDPELMLRLQPPMQARNRSGEQHGAKKQKGLKVRKSSYGRN